MSRYCWISTRYWQVPSYPDFKKADKGRDGQEET